MRKYYKLLDIFRIMNTHVKTQSSFRCYVNVGYKSLIIQGVNNLVNRQFVINTEFGNIPKYSCGFEFGFVNKQKCKIFLKR